MEAALDAGSIVFPEARQAATSLALSGDSAGAREVLVRAEQQSRQSVEIAACWNDRAVLLAAEGESVAAYRLLRRAQRLAPEDADIATNLCRLGEAEQEVTKVRVAVLSLLFNWPSTAGGTVHTAETVKFLNDSGFRVRHFVARNELWDIGRVGTNFSDHGEILNFSPQELTRDLIIDRFRKAVDEFQADYCIITDSWNFKPWLARAVDAYPYFLRLAAQECLCPLNNVRLVPSADGQLATCGEWQLRSPDSCRDCVATNQHLSGGLHQAERALSGFGSDDYVTTLQHAFDKAAGVLVVNPTIAERVAPYCRSVHVVPSGFDSGRFEVPVQGATTHSEGDQPFRVVFAGIVEEPMKGFRVLEEAVQLLIRQGNHVEIHATADPPGWRTEHVYFTGWQSQEELPDLIRSTDVLAFPTIAEEGLGRSAIEAMGCSRPVVASRIGGLTWTVQDGETGLLFTPGDATDLAAKLQLLIDSPELCQRLGLAGRQRFEREFTWESVIRTHYRKLLLFPDDPGEVAVEQAGGNR